MYFGLSKICVFLATGSISVLSLYDTYPALESNHPHCLFPRSTLKQLLVTQTWLIRCVPLIDFSLHCN